MSSRIRIASIFAVAAFLAVNRIAAADPLGIGSALMLQILENADFEARLSLCTRLGKSAEPGVGDVIEFLQSRLPPRSVTESQCLLSALLDGLLNPAWGPEGVAGRFGANRMELEAILRRLAELRDPRLAALLVRTLLLIGDSAHAGSILRLADVYRERLSKTSGRLDPAGTQCVLAMLFYAAEMGSAEFLEPCLSLMELSRDGTVIRAARSAASRIAARVEETSAARALLSTR